MLRNRLEDVNEKASMAGQQISTGQYIPPTRRRQLEQQREMLHHQLTVVDKAIAALDAHPDLEEFAETLARAGV